MAKSKDELKEYMRQYMREYSRRPHVIAKRKDYEKHRKPRNRERELERLRAFRHRNPQYCTDAKRKHQYGVTREQFDAMVAKQAGACAICREPENKMRNGKIIRLSIDHDHKTGFVRGLLCKMCNTALGLMVDEPARLRAAAIYLESSQS